MFELLINGVGDAFSVRHWGTSFLVRAEGFTLAVDCPDSYRRALATNAFDHGGRALEASDLDGLVLTHLHGDHVNGLEMCACYLKFGHGRTLPVWAAPPTSADLWSRLRPSLGVLRQGGELREQSLGDFLDLRPVAWGEAFRAGPFTIEPRPTAHHMPAMAMRIEYDGARLGYSCDTVFDEKLIEWLEPCDLILHETSLGEAHTPLARLAALPEALRAKMMLVHYPDFLADRPPDAIRLAREGATLEVSGA